MTDRTARLSLPFLMADQAQKHLTHNEALERLDALVQLAVSSSATTELPAAPSEGECVLVAETASGALAGRAGEIVAFQSGAWTFHVPRAGWLVFALDRQVLLVFDGAAWVDAVDSASDRFEQLGIAADADAVDRLTVKSPSTLFDHADAGHQLKINKASVGETASVLFQTAYSGRAEIGTIGSEFLQVKVSSDGAVWRAAVTVHPATGNVGIGAANPNETLHLKTDAAFCSLRLERGNSSTRMRHFDGGADMRDAVFDIDPIPGSGTAAAEIRYFRNMSTSAPSGVRILRGNGTATANSYLAANADSYLNASTGNLGVGTSAPTTKLHVGGPVRVGSAAVASMPSAASCGAGTLVFVPDAAGGAAMAFSDGANWRRVHDNQPLA